MGHSKNDYHRNKYDRDDEYNYRQDLQERKRHLQEKRLTNALRSKDVSSLYDLDDE